MENENEVLEDFSNTSEESDSQTDNESFFDSDEEEVDYKAKYEAEAEARRKAEEVARNQKIRAEKAERKPKEPESKTDEGLSTKDLLALMQAKVAEDDIDDVVEYAQFKKIPVAQALKSSAVKAILAEKQENREVAEASHTGTARRGSSRVSDETLLANANKGILPESDSDIQRLVALTVNRKK